MADLAQLFMPSTIQPGQFNSVMEAVPGQALDFKRQMVMQEVMERGLAPEDGDQFFKFVGRRLFEMGDIQGAMEVSAKQQEMQAQQQKSSMERAKLGNTIRGTDIKERAENRQQAEFDRDAGITGGFEMSPEGNEVFVERDINGNPVSVKNLGGANTKIDIDVDARPPKVGGTEATKPTINDLQSQVLSAGESIGRLTQIEQLYDQNFLTLEGKIGQWWRTSKDFLGLNLSDAELGELDAYSDFKSTALDNLNLVLNQLSGAAISPAEAKRIQGAWPDASNDSPRQFITKVRARMRDLKLAKARATYILGGGGTLEDIETGRLSINGMKNIIAKKIRVWKKQGLSDQDIIERRKDTFGM